MKKKTLKYSISAAVLAAMLQATPTFAVTQDQINATQGQINATQGKIDDFETKVQKLDDQITIAMDKSQNLNDAMKVQQGKIEKAKADMEKAQNDLDAHKMVYSDRLKSIQSEGQQPIITYAEILLSSNNISEFLTRFTAVSQILQSDTDLLNGLNQKEQALKDSEKKLNNEVSVLKNEKAELAVEQKKIESDKKEVEKELADAKNTLQQQQTTKQQQQQQMDQQIAAQKAAQLAAQEAAQLAEQRAQQLAKQQAAAQSHSSGNSAAALAAPSNTSQYSSDLADSVVANAEKYLGTPYVWGGTTPSGFDCSGFVQYVFRSVGISLPRVARDQQNVGTRISPDQVQKGDLVFKGDPAYHVGIYIGNGEWIQSPETGDVVKISSYNPSKFSSAARILH